MLIDFDLHFPQWLRRGAEQGEEELPHVQSQGRQPRGATPSGWSGVAAESARLWHHRSSPEELPSPKARGGCQEELPHAGGLEEQPHIQGAVAAQALEGLEELFHVQGRKGWWWGDTPIQGKEQRLCFAGAAVKRYPMSKVRETQVRQ